MSDDINIRDLRRGVEADDYSDVGDVDEQETSDVEDYTESEPSEEGADVVYLSDDSDRERDGVHDTPLETDNEAQALRDDLAENLEDLLADAETWLELTDDEDAQAIYNLLEEAYDRLGTSIAETDDEVAGEG